MVQRDAGAGGSSVLLVADEDIKSQHCD